MAMRGSSTKPGSQITEINSKARVKLGAIIDGKVSTTEVSVFGEASFAAPARDTPEKMSENHRMLI